MEANDDHDDCIFLKMVLSSVTVPMAILIFLFSTCRMFRVCSACLIPSFTRCRHVERSLTISSQLCQWLQTSYPSCKHLKRRCGQPVLRVPFSLCQCSLEQRWSVTLHGAMPGYFYGNSGLPKRQDPPLCFSDVIQRKAEQSNQICCRNCWKGC